MKNIKHINPEFNFDYKNLYFRRTKIIATMGPASLSDEILKRLILKGLDVARINFSHGDPKEHLKNITKIRKMAKKLNKTIAILGDLCGPKIRVGKFKNNQILLKENTTLYITTKSILGHEKLIPTQYKGIIKEVKIGDKILLDDGNLELKVIKCHYHKIEAKVIHGGILKNNKGMNLPDSKLHIPALTEKDKRDALYCIKGEVDYIALSFVRTAKDIIDLRHYLNKHNSDIPIIAKIEKPEALDHMDEIIQVADGIMVARGDLGVEMAAEKVPLIQHQLIKKANQHDKPVIVATQMLESMIEHSRPTRAEVTDVASACLSNADAVMLSGETAVGKYPLETVSMMDSILRQTEAYQFYTYKGRFQKQVFTRKNELLDAISVASAQISRDLMVRCIAALTRSGRTARFISGDKPAAPIIALTHSEKIQRRLKLLWGVVPHLVHKELSINEFIPYAEGLIKSLHLAKRDDYIILLSGITQKNQITNSIVIHKIS